jgi:hypothetical protein
LPASYNSIDRGAAIELMLGFDFLYHSSNATADSLLGCTCPSQLTERNNGPLALIAPFRPGLKNANWASLGIRRYEMPSYDRFPLDRFSTGAM